MEFSWRYADSTCGSNDAAKWKMGTVGGSKLLATDAGVDTTLVQLQTNPPPDTLYAGWSATPLNYQDVVVGIHHDWINGEMSPKLYSAGYFLDYADIQNGNVVGANGGRL